MDLLIDIGNTRIKWAMLDGLRISQQQAAQYSGWQPNQITEHILSALPKPARVLVANVGGAAIGASVAAAVQTAFNLTAEFFLAQAAAAGLRSAYYHPEKLGVDRWLAMIAAFHLARRATCVVSIGTAMTVDGVTATGQHLGGVIVPGPALMISSLFNNTSDIATRAADGTEGTEFFADNTLAAVDQGAAHSLAATIERACHDMYARLGEMPALIITGGASSRVTGALRVPFQFVPDLVLRGLAELARN